MHQRYYDPRIGMFLSVDPVTAHSDPVGQFHRYRYANNNPYKFTDPDGRCAASRLQAVCAMGATMFNSLGMAAQATFRQTQMVRPVNGANSTPEQAAVQFGNDTQQEAADTQREPQAGIVQTGESSYQYTKPMWGGEGQRIVDVSEYTEALTYVYGASAVGFAHGHWDTNPLFTRHDVGIFQQEPDFPFTVFMHNQAGQTRKMSSSIFRSELRRGRRDGLRTFEDYLRVHSGMEGVCIAGC